MEENRSALSGAIILQAVKDYRTAGRRARARPGQKLPQATIREAERFFRSRWFAELTDTAMHLKDVPESRPGDPQRNETIYAEIDAAERELREAEEEAEKVREEVYRTVCRLSDPLSQRTIICHYLQGLSWRSTAEKMRYCLTQVYRFRDAGYEELEKMPDAAVTDRVK